MSDDPQPRVSKTMTCEWRDGLVERVYREIRKTLPKGAFYDVRARHRTALALDRLVQADDDALPAEPTDAEVEAGADALALRFFLGGKQYPLVWFDENQQRSFREKARAVLIAAAAVRRG